ncbi:MAG: histidine phosphatase family protein [Myxococcota bacterium]
MQRALLVRHCESSGQAPEAPLTARGNAQAEALAEFLASQPIARVVSSPYLRARQSVEPLARKLGLEIELDARLAERRLSPTPIDGWRDVVKRSFEDPEWSVPGGESGGETLARGLAAIRPLLESAASDRLVVVSSHGQLLSLVLHSIDARFGFAGWEALSNPDVHALEANEVSGLAFRRVWS